MNESNSTTAVLPMHDPGGLVLSHLVAARPSLKHLFGSVHVGLTAATVASQPELVSQLQGDRSFRVHVYSESMPAGDQFRQLYALSVAASTPEQILHLCFPDRLAYALSGRNRATFLADMAAIEASDVPMIFQRSEKAWSSHPANYRRLEGIVTDVGQMLFGRAIDFAWCHLVVTAGQLAAVLPETSRQDLSIVAEMVIHLMDQIGTKDVDWLAWEDPFIHGRDPQELKAEQEANPAEVHKRLTYVLPMLDVLAKAAQLASTN